jgi:hypothetical protein
MSGAEVGDRGAKKLRIVAKIAEATVAVLAEKAPDLLGLMAVIYRQKLETLILASADCASAALRFQQLVIFFEGDAIALLKVVRL